MLKIRLNQCTGKLTYKVPRDCICTSDPPVFLLKIRRAGTCEYIHHFIHDEIDGELVSFNLDGEIRNLAEGYWQADLFAGCDWIGESMLIKERPSVTAIEKADMLWTCDESCPTVTPPCCEPTIEPCPPIAEPCPQRDHNAQNCC